MPVSGVLAWCRGFHQRNANSRRLRVEEQTISPDRGPARTHGYGSPARRTPADRRRFLITVTGPGRAAFRTHTRHGPGECQTWKGYPLAEPQGWPCDVDRPAGRRDYVPGGGPGRPSCRSHPERIRRHPQPRPVPVPARQPPRAGTDGPARRAPRGPGGPTVASSRAGSPLVALLKWLTAVRGPPASCCNLHRQCRRPEVPPIEAYGEDSKCRRPCPVQFGSQRTRPASRTSAAGRSRQSRGAPTGGRRAGIRSVRRTDRTGPTRSRCAGWPDVDRGRSGPG